MRILTRRNCLYAACLIVGACITVTYSFLSYAQDPPFKGVVVVDLSSSSITIYDGSAEADSTMVIRQETVGVPAVDYILSWLNPVRSIDVLPLSEPPDFADDCEALEHFSETEAYIAQACSLADVLFARMQDCEADVQNLVAAIDTMLVDGGVPTTPPPDTGLSLPACPLSTSFGYIGPLDSSAPICSECPTALSNIFRRVDALNYLDSVCQQLRDDAIQLFFSVQADLAGSPDAFDLAVLSCVYDVLSAMSSQATQLLGSADFSYNAIQSSKGTCDFATLSTRCVVCGGSLPTLLGAAEAAINFLPTGAVQEVDGAPLLEAVVDALARSITEKTDPALAERIGNLIKRLSSDAEKLKIRHIVIRSASKDTNVYIAINPDDKAKLNVVMLTVLAFDPNLPNPNLVDEQQLFEAFNLFADSLTAPL